MKICEVCGSKEAKDLINIAIKVGYELGDYGKSFEAEYEVKPRIIQIFSIHLCWDCKDKIKNKNKFFRVDVMEQLKDLIKTNWTKKMILESLSK